MSKIRCQAKDPANCSYHNPNAGSIQHAKYEDAQNKMQEAVVMIVDGRGSQSEYNAYLDAKSNLDHAQAAYHATPEGIAHLEKKISEAENQSQKRDLEDQLEIAQYHVKEAERQNGIDNEAGGSIASKDDFVYEVPKYTRSGDDLWPETTGSKYDATLNTRTIATKLSADFKEAQRGGYLPRHLKFKVSPNSSSRNIRVTIIGASQAQIYDEIENNNGYSVPSSNADELQIRVKNLTDAYNRKQDDTVEGRTNRTNYWSSVEFERDFDKSNRIEREKASAAKRKAKMLTTNN
jgi:hypothetical protein